MAIGTTTAVVAGLAIATSLASAGMAFYGQQQQARAAQDMAAYNNAIHQQNYAVQKQQMEMQAQMAAMAAQQQQLAYENNAKMMENEAVRANQEAVRVEQEARERARRMRMENDKLLGAQRARYGASGVTSEGSPLLVMAETAGALEMGVADELYKGELMARASRLEGVAFTRKAEVERWQAGYSMIDEHAARYNQAAAAFRASPHLMEGRKALIEGRNTASALRTASYGSLLDGASGAFGMGMNLSMAR
jgi:hypothetical protein